MRHLSPDLASTIAERHGIVDREQLISFGWSRHRIQAAVAARELIVCHPGVYRVATSPRTFEARCAAACAADPALVVTGRAAARLWEFRHVRYDGPPIVLAEHDRNPISGEIVLRRTNQMSDTDRLHRPDGIVIASPTRTWFDCARDLPDERFEAVTEWVLDHHASIPMLWSIVRRMSARGRPGLARVRRVLSQRSDWQRPAGSMLELRVLKALQAIGVPELVRQLPIRLPDGTVIHPDAADPDLRWALEVDHVTWHGGRADAQRDKARDRGLRRIGWQVERVTDQEVAERFDATVREIAELYWARRRELAA